MPWRAEPVLGASFALRRSPFPAAAATIPVLGAKQALLLHLVPAPDGGTAAVTDHHREAGAGAVMPCLVPCGKRQFSGTASSNSMYSNGIGSMPGGRLGAT